ncbi:MAG: adenine phosphoribosyltransferase [Candidatus Hydrogenedentes bacterium]|nr:adenine phosphoribosyltransferase [Candidatus Hydrogenedentota bacterium]
MDLVPLIRNVPDFPKPGIQFKDVTTLLQYPEAFKYIIDGWKKRYGGKGITAIVGAEARGFIFGAALAYAMDVPFVPARKKGKLPADTICEEYELEYGTAVLEIHADALKKGDRTILIDDLLATGGTMKAVANMVERLGAEIVEIAFVIELLPLGGRERLSGYPVHALVEIVVDE